MSLGAIVTIAILAYCTYAADSMAQAYEPEVEAFNLVLVLLGVLCAIAKSLEDEYGER